MSSFSSQQLAEAHTKPRTIKTHLAFSLLPKNLLDTCKVVYMFRNPMDNVLSALHHYKLVKIHSFVGTQDDFVDMYVDDLRNLYSPYGQHLREAWARRGHPNLHVVSFEELKSDTRAQLCRLDAFLGTRLTDQQLENVLQKTSFKTMQDSDPFKTAGHDAYNRQVGEQEGLFVRQGEAYNRQVGEQEGLFAKLAGTWKEKISQQQQEKLEDWIKKNFTDYGIKFRFD
ncbi:sulfotransferase 1C4-like [Hyalella azteca]|uniref:Sulfotransferase 1C4-like n=1 Tax=Hyalella azteca TaxID=294128 RepID=A0A979FWI3_HYAAZ|nr:sulfotransferase 1C4-like [Hyalella azteca]